MLRCSRVSRTALLSTTLLRQAAVPPQHTSVEATKTNTEAAAGSATPLDKAGVLQQSREEASAPSMHLVEDSMPPPPPPPQHRQPKFLFKGRRGSMAPEYYSTRSSAGHPDPVAELLGAGRDDPEWMWLKLLCFLCATATFGSTLYGYFFAEHVKYFKDEPWSPFTY